ncbi:MAG: enoyl-CoA hydratase/isomerase family protein [Desulfobacterales bacterium]|nr:enoyl-CoA hydratase/isomerase family protein [Desulfobacterales bacterium]
MADMQFIRLDTADGVARITLARPKHNVLDIAMMNELSNALEALAVDDALKCVVFGAEGRSWCAGVEVADHQPAMAPDMIAAFNRMLGRIEAMEVPTVAAVQGACLGGGMEAAIACDTIIASDKAKFGQPEVKLGFFPPYAAIRLPPLIGAAKTIEICTFGKIYRASEAQAMGFVTHVVAADDFTEYVDRFIQEIHACSPLIVRLNKRAVRNHLGLTAEPAVARVSDYFLNTLMKTEDVLEGIASFEEKRQPVWKNK